VHPFMSVEIL